jgi:hypothetical protein
MLIAQEHASNFEGFHKRREPPPLHDTSRSASEYISIEQHEADLHHLRLAAAVGARRSAVTENAEHGLMVSLLEQGTGLSQVIADGNAGGMQRLGSVDIKSADDDALAAALRAQTELQAVIAERERVDVVMAAALKLVLWDAGVAESLAVEPETGAAAALPPGQSSTAHGD